MQSHVFGFLFFIDSFNSPPQCEKEVAFSKLAGAFFPPRTRFVQFMQCVNPQIKCVTKRKGVRSAADEICGTS